MREYPRLVYKDGETKKVFNESEEVKASSDGWDCARNPEKIALKESMGKGILREQVTLDEQITDAPVVKTRRKRRTKAEIENERNSK